MNCMTNCPLNCLTHRPICRLRVLQTTLAAGVLLLGACSGGNDDTAAPATASGEPAGIVAAAPAAPARIEPLRAIVETNRGTFTIDLFEEETPLTVANFALLASQGFYDDQEFYGRSVVVRQLGRPVPEFSPGWTLPREFAPGSGSIAAVASPRRSSPTAMVLPRTVRASL